MAELRIVWSPAAEQDLLDIWAYLAKEASPNTADRQLRKIGRTCHGLADTPLHGRSRNELAPALRSVAAHPYVAFYRVASEAIEIVRVLHGRRDIGALFDEGG